MGESIIYTFGEHSTNFTKNHTTYSVLLNEMNGVKKSALTFFQVPDNTFSLSCFNGSISSRISIMIKIASKLLVENNAVLIIQLLIYLYVL